MTAVDLLVELDAYTVDHLAAMSDDEFDAYTAQYDIAYALLSLEREGDWSQWLPFLFPSVFSAGFAEHHGEFWDWLWSIELGVKPDAAFIAVWSRGGAKSSSAEAGVVALAARKRRKYGLYVCDTQAQADTHVETIGGLLESKRVALAYPELGERLVSKYGSSKGWRRNRLRTASGFTIDALGLDSAARGLKMDEDRPDLIVFDDIDDQHDSRAVTERKIEDLTMKLLPAGGESLAVLGIQNLPNPHGIFARLAGVAEEPAEFLRERIVSGPVPAVRDATYERNADGGWEIVAGVATWEGQSVERCNVQIAEWGFTAFIAEAQHDTNARGGGMFDHLEYRHCARDAVPDLVRKAVWVDPAVTAKDSSDAHGCIVDGIATTGTIYRLRAWERRATPVDALRLAIVWAALEGVTRVGVETDQGGDTWSSVYKEALEAVRDDLAKLVAGDEVAGDETYMAAIVELASMDPRDVHLPPFHDEEKAGSSQLSKVARANQMLADYERPNRIVHALGDHLLLERGLNRFPRTKPFDLVDAAYWSWRDLRRGGVARTSGRQAARSKLPPARLVGAR